MADEKFKMCLKNKFPHVCSEGLGKCSKIKATQCSAPFAALERINKELDRLQNIGVISLVDYTDWSAPTVYVKKKYD